MPGAAVRGFVVTAVADVVQDVVLLAPQRPLQRGQRAGGQPLDLDQAVQGAAELVPFLVGLQPVVSSGAEIMASTRSGGSTRSGFTGLGIST